MHSVAGVEPFAIMGAEDGQFGYKLQVYTQADSDIKEMKDLAGKRIGIAGGPDSKGWILLKKVAQRQGINLEESAQLQFAAPPLLSQALKRGQVDVIVTYWHFAARLRGEGGWRHAMCLLLERDADAVTFSIGTATPLSLAVCEEYRKISDYDLERALEKEVCLCARTRVCCCCCCSTFGQ